MILNAVNDFINTAEDRGYYYDTGLKLSSQHNAELAKRQPPVTAKEMPAIEAKFLREHKTGCCLHFSMALLDHLAQFGEKGHLVITPEPNGGSHCSVLIKDLDGLKVIDIVEIIKHRDVGSEQFIEPLSSFKAKNDFVCIYEYTDGRHGDEPFFTQFVHSRFRDFKKRR